MTAAPVSGLSSNPEQQRVKRGQEQLQDPYSAYSVIDDAAKSNNTGTSAWFVHILL
jgi:hypothetical protein